MPEEVKPPQAGAANHRLEGPGASPVGIRGIVLLAVYLASIAVFLLYCLVIVWPQSGPHAVLQAGKREVQKESPVAGQTASSDLPKCPEARNDGIYPSTFFFGTFWISDEVRLMLIVMLAGALGSLIHALRSLSWYVGNRSLIHSWLLMFLLLPLIGATLGIIFYLVVRGGFFSPQASFKDLSPFGFAALAGLTGMFSPQAVLKLKQVAEILLTKPKEGQNAKPQD